MNSILYLLFFLSGLSGLIYQVVWVRVFGNVFGNTIYSASIVIAVFMLGLGVGSYVVGAWADRRYAAHPDSLLRAYAYVELLIGALGLAISMLLPHLDRVSALVSAYTREANGWYALSATSYVARAGIAAALLAPITLLMGGTLTLLIRHLVRSDLTLGSWRIAALYAVNTLGAALGCFLTDFALVPASGLQATQMVAVGLNLIAGLGALYLSRLEPAPTTVRLTASAKATAVKKPDTTTARKRGKDVSSVRPDKGALQPDQGIRPLVFTSMALALAGFAAMGMEILWFRHVTILLGGFRAVFSLLLTVILLGIGMGSLAGGFLHRRTARPAEWFMGAQALFVAFTLLGLGLADARPIDAAATFDPGVRGATGFAGTLAAESGLALMLGELWFNARPILIEVAVPALLMGFSFPLANGIIQRAEHLVGRRAGLLYLANTAGAVCGSLAAGFFLLPALGIQGSATVLAIAAASAIVPLYFASVGADLEVGLYNAGAAGLAIVALIAWQFLPSDHVNLRALPQLDEDERRLALSEGLTELIAVTESAGAGRTLLTNGHPMSSTLPLSQRYMRALAHIPLLSMETPDRVLVIGFGVGNTSHAATLHSSVRRVEIADLSRDILGHASYFSDVDGNVLNDARVQVYVNDGRQHLQMQPPGSYDLVTLEPPPIAYAGVGALYSREFYELARTRLAPGGYVSQWLPAYQVPTTTTLAMIRAFIDVFPRAVLLSGAEADLVLLGTNGPQLEIDPVRLTAALVNAPAARADLARLDLGTPREIVGTFVGSAQRLADATRTAAPVTDDNPLQEYGVRSLLNLGEAVPAAAVDLSGFTAWCPRCLIDGRPDPRVAGLDTYFALLDLAYAASAAEVAPVRDLGVRGERRIAGSAYLGAIVPESAEVYNLLGITLASRGDLDQAIAEFQHALALDPQSAETHWHLGAALASRGELARAIEHLRRSVQLDPSNADARRDLEAVQQLGPRARRAP